MIADAKYASEFHSPRPAQLRIGFQKSSSMILGLISKLEMNSATSVDSLGP